MNTTLEATVAPRSGSRACSFCYPFLFDILSMTDFVCHLTIRRKPRCRGACCVVPAVLPRLRKEIPMATDYASPARLTRRYFCIVLVYSHR